MNVLVIPEDFVNDQYILKPIIDAMFAELDRPTANVRVCHDPRLRGIAQATDWGRLERIIDRYRGMVDLFLLCVDRDGIDHRRATLDQIEEKARQVLQPGRTMLAENAWQEIEVWVLAGHRLPTSWLWTDVRAEINPKERYFVPFARSRGLADQTAQGRKVLAAEASRRYDRIQRLCSEDIGNLHARIGQWLAATP